MPLHKQSRNIMQERFFKKISHQVAWRSQLYIRPTVCGNIRFASDEETRLIKNHFWLKEKMFGSLLLPIISGFFIGALLPSFAVDAKTPGQERVFRILHIMSFDSPWRWTDGQFSGFKEGLAADMDDYLSKLFSREALVNLLDHWTEKIGPR